MQKRKEDLILKAVNYDPFGDFDMDGVQNILDCKPYDKTRDGFFRDLGGAIKTEIKGEVGEAKERIVKGIAGEERREQRKELREAEHEAYLEEAKEMAQERGKEKAQRKFTKHRIGEGFGEKVEDLEEKVEKFAKKAGKHGKGMLEGFDEDEDELLYKKSHKKVDKHGRSMLYSKKPKKIVKKRRGILGQIDKEIKSKKMVTISVPRKPVPSARSQKPLIAPLTISMPKRTKKPKTLLGIGF